MIKFILHQPRNPKNIGAAARGMANFGFRNLSVVAPYSKAWRETRSAVHASPVVLRAKKYDTLQEALRTCHVIIGTSAGSRRADSQKFIGVAEVRAIVDAAEQKKRRIAIIFGSEKSGLSNEDLSFCHYVARLPTVPSCPSMNLAQAVAVTAYILRRDVTMLGSGMAPETPPLSTANVERLIHRGFEAFKAAGLLKGWDDARSEQRVRKAFYRWNLNEVDIAMLHALFRWIVKKAGG